MKSDNENKALSFETIPVEAYIARMEYALVLINGKDVMCGDEYLGTINDPEEKRRGYLIINDLYEQIKHLENEVNHKISELPKYKQEDLKYADKRLYVMNEIYDYYNTDVKHILDLILSKTENKLLKSELYFREYLYHDNKDKLIGKLHELLDSASGKNVAIVIQALIKLGYLANFKSKSALYKAMRTEFGDIGTNQNLNDFLNPNNKKIQDKDLLPLITILRNV